MHRTTQPSDNCATPVQTAANGHRIHRRVEQAARRHAPTSYKKWEKLLDMGLQVGLQVADRQGLGLHLGLQCNLTAKLRRWIDHYGKPPGAASARSVVDVTSSGDFGKRADPAFYRQISRPRSERVALILSNSPETFIVFIYASNKPLGDTIRHHTRIGLSCNPLGLKIARFC